MAKERCFHSCFVVDVKCSGSTAKLIDSTKTTWNVDLSDGDLAQQFKKWLESVFLKGVAQTLTVFEYEDRSAEMDFEFWVKKFCSSTQAA